MRTLRVQQYNNPRGSMISCNPIRVDFGGFSVRTGEEVQNFVIVSISAFGTNKILFNGESLLFSSSSDLREAFSTGAARRSEERI